MSKSKFLDEVKDNKKFIIGVFVKNLPSKVDHGSLPGVTIYTPDSLCDGVQVLLDRGIDSLLLFGVGSKNSLEEAYENGNIVEKSIEVLRNRFQDRINIFADVGLSPYTQDGHSVVINKGEVVEDESLEIAGKMAVSYAKAGADFVAPCLSVGGQVAYLRKTLNDNNLEEVGIMAYSAKFASSFYGPYRKTIESPLSFGGKDSYQLSIEDADLAIKTIIQDDEEGADILMVKPAMNYGDIILKSRLATKKPVAVYNVSGEYCMIKAAAEKGWVDEKLAFTETFKSFFRAGADIVITYDTSHAQDL